MAQTPSASYSIIVRCQIENRPGMLGRLTSAIGAAGGDIGAIDIVRQERGTLVRDVTINCRDDAHGQTIVQAITSLDGITVVNVSDRTFLLHLGGKIEVTSKAPLRTRDDLSMAYTPGVARVCRAIADDPAKVWNLTIKQNTVAVVTDGTAVLGLGDIGPEAAMPVMEGKAMLFKEFAGGAAVLRDRAPAARDARHPRLPRRPARDGGGGARIAPERAAGGREATRRRA